MITPIKKKINKILKTGEIQNKKIELSKIDYEDLPAKIKPSKNFISALKWKDLNGENYLIIYRVGPTVETDIIDTDDEKYAELHVKQYVFQNKNYTKIWEVIDFVRNCAYDLWIGPASKDAFYVTDLNNNGITETSFIYYLSCRSDASPSIMKLIMREGNQKFALRGTSILNRYLIDIDLENFNPKLNKNLVGNNNGSTSFLLKTMGKYENDEDFCKNPKLLEFAKEKWIENMIEKEMKQFK